MYPSWRSVFISGPSDTHGQIMNANVYNQGLSNVLCLLMHYQSNDILFLASIKYPRWKSSSIYVHTKCVQTYCPYYDMVFDARKR